MKYFSKASSSSNISASIKIKESEIIFGITPESADNLPNPAELTGRTYQIKRINTDHHVFLSSNTLIDSFSIISMDSTSPESIEVISNGDQWFITNSYQTTGNSLSGLGNLLFWIDASSSPISLVNGNVAQINDLSGNDDHAMQADTTKQPELVIDALNGKPLLRFDGDDFLNPSNLMSGNVFSIFSVIKAGTVSGLDTWLSTRVGASEGFELTVRSTGALWVFYFNSTAQYNLLSSGPSAISNYMIMTTLFKLDGVEFYTNGGYKTSSAIGIDESSALLSIGKKIGASGSANWDGDIAEIIIFNKTVTHEEKNLIENYLRSKWTY